MRIELYQRIYDVNGHPGVANRVSIESGDYESSDDATKRAMNALNAMQRLGGKVDIVDANIGDNADSLRSATVDSTPGWWQQLKEAHTQVREFADEIKRLTGELSDEQARFSAANSEVRRLNSELASYKEKLEAEKARSKGLENVVADIDRQVEVGKSLIAKIEKRGMRL